MAQELKAALTALAKDLSKTMEVYSFLLTPHCLYMDVGVERAAGRARDTATLSKSYTHPIP